MPVEAFGWLLIILVLVLILFVAVAFLRKRLHDADEPGEQSAFTLGDLRQLLKRGKLTPAEFERLRDQIVAAAKKDAPDPLARRKPKPPENEPPGGGL